VGLDIAFKGKVKRCSDHFFAVQVSYVFLSSSISINIKEAADTAALLPGPVANLFPPGSINDPAAIQRLLAHGTFPWQFIPLRLWTSPRCL
jgi:hypothetical protein